MEKAKKLGGVAKGGTNPVVVRVALFSIVYLGVSAYVMSGLRDGELQEVAPYFLVAIFIQFIPFIVRSRPEPLEPACLASFMTLMALIPGLTAYVVAGQVQLNLLPQVSGHTRVELVQTVMIAYSVGTIAYLAGYYMGIGPRIWRIFPDVAGGTWKRSRFLHVSLVAAAIFLPAYAYFQSKVGVSLTDFTQLAAGKAVWRGNANGALLLRATALGFVPCILLVALNFPGFRWSRAIGTLALLAVVSLLTVRIGQRGAAVYCLLNALIVVHYLWRRIPLSLLSAIGFVVMVAMNLLGEYRTTRNDQYTASQTGPTANFDVTSTLAEHEDDRERISAMAVVFYFFPERKDYLLGESWGPILTTFIPRALWPEKAWTFMWRETTIVRQLVGAPMPVNYLGLLYANFSWLGVLFGMYGWGAFQRGLYEWLLKNPKDRSVVVLYSFAVLYVGPTLLQISGAVGFVLPVYVAIRYMRIAPPKVKKLLGAKLASSSPSSPSAEPSPVAAVAPTAAE